MRFIGPSVFAFFIAVALCTSTTGAVETGTANRAAASQPEQNDPGDEAPDPSAQHLRDIGQAYQTATFKFLSTSASPRDWVWATMVNPLDPIAFEEANRRERGRLLDRAALAAPNDALVQWIAVLHSHTTASWDVANGSPLEALQRLEPNNAAVWMEALIAASKSKDSGAMEAALKQMAACTRYDEHFADILKGLLGVYARYPMPDEYFSIISASAKFPTILNSKQALSYTSTMAVVAAFALPPYQTLMQACTINPATGENADRAGTCAAIGRLLAARATSLIANRIGYAVLRVSRTFNAEDVQRARVDDWIYQQRVESFDSQRENAGEEIIANIDSWIETGSELESMRCAVARAGRPLAPSMDWVDERSPFSAQKLLASGIVTTEAH